MDIKCDYPNCNSTFYFSGHGRVPHLCHSHRQQINRENAARWHREHYRSHRHLTTPSTPPTDPESIVRPKSSHLYSGPGLFEPLPDLFNHAITVKARTLNLPKDYVRNFWIFGQAGQQFMRSFLHPDR